MYSHLKKIYSLTFGLMLASCAGVAFADTVLLELSMEENSFAPRTGPLKVLTVDTGVSPYGGDLSEFNTGLFVTASWGSICGTNIFLAGGEASGWLLGPATDASFPDFTIDFLHDQLRASVGLGPGDVATQLWAVLDDAASGVAGSGSALRFPCSGSTNAAEFAVLYFFLWENPTFFEGKGFYVGDLIFSTEIGTQLYFLYSN